VYKQVYIKGTGRPFVVLDFASRFSFRVFELLPGLHLPFFVFYFSLRSGTNYQMDFSATGGAFQISVRGFGKFTATFLEALTLAGRML
jgi:hypothetical protein